MAASKPHRTPPSRRGRPRAGEQAARRQAVLDAALDELLEHGYEQVTMASIARRAGASKETLYNWFGNRTGLFTALIEANADGSATRVSAALADDTDPIATLTGYAAGLLTLLTSPPSVALNRAAMTDLELAEVLLASGRHRIGPVVEHYLAQLHERSVIHAPDPAEAFTLLYGLIMEDTQIRVLLGEKPPSSAAIGRRATSAVERFVALSSPA